MTLMVAPKNNLVIAWFQKQHLLKFVGSEINISFRKLRQFIYSRKRNEIKHSWLCLLLKNNTLFAFSSSVLIWISLLAQPNLLSQIKFLRNWNHSEDKQVLCYELKGSSEVLYWITKFFFMSHICKITFSLSTNVNSLRAK